jgi:hypothetical protein
MINRGEKGLKISGSFLLSQFCSLKGIGVYKTYPNWYAKKPCIFLGSTWLVLVFTNQVVGKRGMGWS